MTRSSLPRCSSRSGKDSGVEMLRIIKFCETIAETEECHRPRLLDPEQGGRRRVGGSRQGGQQHNNKPGYQIYLPSSCTASRCLLTGIRIYWSWPSPVRVVRRFLLLQLTFTITTVLSTFPHVESDHLLGGGHIYMLLFTFPTLNNRIVKY